MKIVASVFAVVVTVAIIAPLGWAPLAVAFGALVTTTGGIVHLMLTMLDDESEANDEAADTYG